MTTTSKRRAPKHLSVSFDQRVSEIADILNVPSKRDAIIKDASDACETVDASAVPIPHTDIDYQRLRRKLDKFALAMRNAEIAWNEVCENNDWLIMDEVRARDLDAIHEAFAFGRLCGKEAVRNKKTPVDDVNIRQKRLGIKIAYKLMTDYGVKITVTNEDSALCKVAKLIYLGPDKMFKLCKDYHSAMKAKASKA